MIHYTDDENIIKFIQIEKNSLKATLAIQKNLNRQILAFMKNFIGNININLDFNPENKAFKYMNASTKALNKSNINIHSIEKLLKKIDYLISLIRSKDKTQDIKPLLEAYNKQFSASIDTIFKNTLTIEKFIYKISRIDIAKILKELNSSAQEISSQEPCQETSNNVSDLTISSEELKNSYVENTLIISDIQQKVILPYKIEKIKEVLLDQNEKYHSIQDVIDKLYTIPIKNYKFSSFARFREAYKLIIEKEHGSKSRALTLASELFVNYNLHPAIITACNSLNELDIYLACLEDDTLEDFKFFSIKYEIAPIASSKYAT